MKLLPILALLLSISFFGCKKKCDLPKDSFAGEIKGDYIVYTNTLSPVNTGVVIRSESDSPDILISSDKGVNKVPVDYGEFTILAYPTSTSCNTAFARDVTIDDVNGIVTYSIVLEECSKCEYKVETQNFAVVRAIPLSYQVFFDVKIK